MGAIAKAMDACFEEYGGETICGSGVRQIMVKNGAVTGVALDNGDEYYADVVVSNMTFPRTFLECMDAKDLQPAIPRKKYGISKFAGRPASSILRSTACRTSRRCAGNTELIKGDMHLIDSIERLERAYDDWKDGTWSQDPYIDMLIPSLTDPTMAPPGKHFMSVFVQYVPPKVRWRGMDRCPARPVRAHRNQPDRTLCARLQGADPARRSAHATRTRK